jgi:hypothetical protein
MSFPPFRSAGVRHPYHRLLHRPTTVPAPHDRRHRVERSSNDDPATQDRGGWHDTPPDQAVKVAEPVPSMSAAHWANRDKDTLYRRSGHSRPFDDSQVVPAAPQSAGRSSSLPSTGGIANADLFGPDPERFGPNGEDAEQSNAVGRARHWTTIGTAALRSRRHDRPDPEPKGRRRSGPAAKPVLPEADRKARAAARAAARTARKVARAKTTAPDPDDTIGDLGGHGHEIRPHRAVRQPAGSPAGKDITPKGTATATPRRPRGALWATLSIAVIGLVGGAAGIAILTDKADGLKSVLSAATGSDERHTVTGALAGRTRASFELVTGTNQVTLRTEDLGDNLYRITTASDSGTVPRPVVDENRVQLHLTPSGGGTTGAVEIVLAAKVKWALRFTGGADDQRIDMSQGRISGIDVIGGAHRMELKLPKPAGTVGVRITGAVDEFIMTAPKNNPVRMTLDSGAKTVVAGNRTQRDVPPGSTFTPRKWQVDNRYDVDVAARVTLFSVAAAR